MEFDVIFFRILFVYGVRVRSWSMASGRLTSAHATASSRDMAFLDAVESLCLQPEACCRTCNNCFPSHLVCGCQRPPCGQAPAVSDAGVCLPSDGPCSCSATLSAVSIACAVLSALSKSSSVSENSRWGRSPHTLVDHAENR